MAYLEIETRQGSRTVRLERERLSIGRLSYNDVVLPYAQISRQHAELRCIKGQWWIADLQSTNGLQFDSARIQERALQPGDRITLAPGVSIRFVLDGQASPPSPGVDPRASSFPTPPSTPTPFSPFNGKRPSETARPADAANDARPRSVFADDESPYIPPGHSASQPQWPSSGPLFPGPSAPPEQGRAHDFLPPSRSQGADPSGHRATLGPAPSSANGRASEGGAHGASPFDAFHRSDPHAADPYRRSEGEFEARSLGPSGTAKLLHVCQTCGQLTAPDSVFCQSCHHGIARECPTCQLSLLPIQERCPRCQTANAFSVRRSHPGREG